VTAYAGILALTGRREEFAKIIGRDQVESHWTRILALVYRIWSAAINRPALLAPFSIPEPTGPNQTIAHNWTYASVRLAKDVGQEEQMLEFLRGIESPRSLRTPIELALTTGATSEEVQFRLGDDLDSESDEAFYSGLGRRLVRVLTVEQFDAEAQCHDLLQQCLIRGPRGLDAGVLAEAHRLGVAKNVDQDLVRDYIHRLENDRQLRLAIWPLVAGLR
jgi:hypothetical protein